MSEVPMIQATGAEESVYRSPFVHVTSTPVRFPDGDEGTYARVNPGNRGVVAIARGVRRGLVRYALVRQHRFPVGEVTLELPRGGCEDEASVAGAARELAEETGLVVKESAGIHLGRLHADTGILGTVVDVWVFTARHEPDAVHVEPDTGASLVWLSVHEIRGLIVRGDITCAITLAALTQLWSSSYATLPNVIG